MSRAGNNNITIRPNEKVLEDAEVGTTTPSPFDLDYDLYETWNLTLTGNTTFIESNLPTTTVDTKVIALRVTGDFTLTFPTDWNTNLKGVYVGVLSNLIVVQYLKATEYIVTITQPD